MIKTHDAFPSDEAAMKPLYLALRNLGVYWKPAIEMTSCLRSVRHILPGKSADHYTALTFDLHGSGVHS